MCIHATCTASCHFNHDAARLPSCVLHVSTLDNRSTLLVRTQSSLAASSAAAAADREGRLLARADAGDVGARRSRARPTTRVDGITTRDNSILWLAVVLKYPSRGQFEGRLGKANRTPAITELICDEFVATSVHQHAIFRRAPIASQTARSGAGGLLSSCTESLLQTQLATRSLRHADKTGPGGGPVPSGLGVPERRSHKRKNRR